MFSNYARKDANNECDPDLLVEPDHSKEPIGMKFFVFQNKLEDLLYKKIDLVSEGGISKYIKLAIDKEKLLIYKSAS